MPLWNRDLGNQSLSYACASQNREKPTIRAYTIIIQCFGDVDINEPPTCSQPDESTAHTIMVVGYTI